MPYKPIRYTPRQTEALQNWLRATSSPDPSIIECGSKNAAISYRLSLHTARKKALAEADRERMSGVEGGQAETFYLRIKNLTASLEGTKVVLRPFEPTGFVACDAEGNPRQIVDPLEGPRPPPPEFEELFPSNLPIFGEKDA